MESNRSSPGPGPAGPGRQDPPAIAGVRRSRVQARGVDFTVADKLAIARELDKIGIEKPMTFESLFSARIAKAVLLDYWRMITPDIPVIVCSHFPSSELYDAIQQSQPNTKPTKSLELPVVPFYPGEPAGSGGIGGELVHLTNGNNVLVQMYITPQHPLVPLVAGDFVFV